MQATMMHSPMTVQMLMEHGRQVFPESRVGTFDGAAMTYTSYREIADNAARLAAALQDLGIAPGDRVATFSWNNTAHMEAYLGIPAMGAIMHTVNIRLSAEHIAYIINHAEDRFICVDAMFVPLLEAVADKISNVEGFIIMTDEAHMPETSLPNVMCYETLLAAKLAAEEAVDKAVLLNPDLVIMDLADEGNYVAVRPSGTEPKIKFYFSVKEPLDRSDDFDKVQKSLNNKIASIVDELSLK